MDEPTLAEMIRALQADVTRMRAEQSLYVTKEIMDLKLQALAKDHTDLEAEVIADRARLASVQRWVWSAVVGPVIVGLILYLLIGKTP
jgi:hypothetical protein